MKDDTETKLFVTLNTEYGNWSFTNGYPEGTSWDIILTDFINVLSGVYGYSIGTKVDYHGNPQIVENETTNAYFGNT